MKNLIAIALVVVFTTITSCKIFHKVDYKIFKPEATAHITQGRIDTLIDTLCAYHPEPFGQYTRGQIDSIGHQIVLDNQDKKLSVVDYVLQMRRLVDVFSYNDPHVGYFPVLQATEKPKFSINKIKVLPFDILLIKDTAMIIESYNAKLKMGDVISSINGIDISEFLKYCNLTMPKIPGYVFQVLSQKTFSATYNIGIVRGGEKFDLVVDGINYGHISNDKYGEGEVLDKYHVGYFKIREFVNNNYLVKQMQKIVNATIDAGYENFILDLRGNPGGTGNNLDLFFSLMSDKDTLKNVEDEYLKVSSVSINDYDFVKESQMGELIKMPDSLVYRKFPLDHDYYKAPLNYYVLIDKSTGSTAASFADIVQYNHLGKLVGEPLAHNAVNFGDITAVNVAGLTLVSSTMQYVEYTKRTDGFVYPDISIPYVASEYEKFDDPMLDKLLIRISKEL